MLLIHKGEEEQDERLIQRFIGRCGGMEIRRGNYFDDFDFRCRFLAFGKMLMQ